MWKFGPPADHLCAKCEVSGPVAIRFLSHQQQAAATLCRRFGGGARGVLGGAESVETCTKSDGMLPRYMLVKSVRLGAPSAPFLLTFGVLISPIIFLPVVAGGDFGRFVVFLALWQALAVCRLAMKVAASRRIVSGLI